MNKAVLFSLMLAVMGCSEKNAVEKDNELPAITLTSPSNAQTFTDGQLINITGSVSDNKSLSQIHIHVNNLDTGAEILDEHLNPTSNTATFSKSLIATSGINYRIEIVAVDKAVNEARKTVEVSCN